MPAYRTGTTRTRTMSGTIDFTDGGGTWSSYGSAGFTPSFWITTSWFDELIPEDEQEPVGPGEDPPTTRRRVDITVSVGPSPAQGGNIESWTVRSPAIGLLSGTWSCSVQTEEIIDFDPTLSSVRADDEQTGNQIVSVTIFGRTVSCSASGRIGNLAPASWVIRSNVASNYGSLSGSGEQEIAALVMPTATGSGGGAAIISRSGTVMGGSGYTYATEAETTETSARAAVTLSGSLLGLHPDITADAVAGCTPERNFTFRGRVQSFLQPFSGPVRWRPAPGLAMSTATSGDWSQSYTWRNFDIRADVFTPTGTATARNAQSDPATLESFFEWGTVSAVGLFRGPRWDALRIDHRGAELIDDGASLTPTGTWAGAWSALSGGTISTTGTAIKLTGSAGKGFARTITPWPTMLRGWTRLRIRLKCTAASHTIKVATDGSGARYWDVTTGAADTATDLYIDLGAPTNASPILATMVIGQEGDAFSSDYHGGSLRVYDLGAGDYEIEEVEVLFSSDTAVNEPTLNLLTGLTYQSRRLVAVADAQEIFATVAPSTGSVQSWLSGASWTSRYGVTLTNLAPPTTPTPSPLPISQLTKNGQHISSLGGDGLLYTGSWAIPATTAGRGYGDTMPCQLLARYLSWGWPETDLGGWLHGSATVAAGAVDIAWSGWGRLLENTGTQTAGDPDDPAGLDPASGVLVELLDTTGAAVASSTTSADGWFCLGTNAVRTGALRLRVAGQSGVLEFPGTGQRTRAIIRRIPPPDGTLLAMAVSATGRVVRAYKDGAGLVTLDFWNRTEWVPRVTGISVTGSGALAYDRQSGLQRLWLAYEDSGGIKTRYTDDEGGTWGVAVTITTSGGNPAIIASPTGVRHYYWVDGSAIKTKALDSQDNEVIATTTIVSSGVASSPIDAVHTGQEILLTYRNSSTQVVSVVSSDGGKTFS